MIGQVNQDVSIIISQIHNAAIVYTQQSKKRSQLLSECEIHTIFMEFYYYQWAQIHVHMHTTIEVGLCKLTIR